MILVVILEPFLFSLKYTWMVICILEESFLIIWNVCLTQEQKFEKGWLNDTSYDVFTWYNQLFSVWKGSPVSRWSIHSQKPKPWLPTNDEHPWKSKANSRFFVSLQEYKKMRVIEHTRYIDHDEGRNEGNDDNHPKACVSLRKKFGV